MKRGGPLQRTTPMRRTPMKRGGPRRRLPTVDQGPRPDPDGRFWHGQRKALYERAGGRCERCGVDLDQQYEAHHRMLRSQGGPDDLWNLVALCTQLHGNGCHTGSNGVHSQVTTARETGFIVPSWLDPRTYAVQLYDGRTVRLLEDGTYDTVFDNPGTPTERNHP